MEGSDVTISKTCTSDFGETTTIALDERLSEGWTGSVSEKSEFMDSDSSSETEKEWFMDSSRAGNVFYWDSSMSVTVGLSDYPMCVMSL